ncbi:hypothetical protein [Vibrio phage vB_VhaS-tm]|nr:hypothetical protein [Vibrio phage vB_VhaS-tm]
MVFKIEAWLREYNRSLSAQCGEERYAGNQGVRKGKAPTESQLKSLAIGRQRLIEKRSNSHV